MRTAAVILAAVLSAFTLAASADPDPKLDLSRWRGQVVLLDFWASWCGPCREAFPWMAGMQTKYRDRGLVVVTVNLDQDPDAAARFLRGAKGDFVHVQDPAGALAEEYDVTVMPSSIVFDRDGRPVYRHDGFHMDQAREYESHIVDLLEGRGSEKSLPMGRAGRKRLGVRPWERGLLAARAMALIGDPLESELDDHIYFSKEASSGGRGFGGGGCGCN